MSKECLQPVIIAMQNRVEFMVVTFRASECQSQKCGADGICDVLQNVLPPLHEVSRIPFIRIVTAERRRHASLWIVRPHLVASDLLLHEPVVGFVLVQRFNDIIAIAPDIGSIFVGAEAVAFRVTRRVQPMSRPPLAIVWRRRAADRQPFHRRSPSCR